jgi:hypothetical protein
MTTEITVREKTYEKNTADAVLPGYAVDFNLECKHYLNG